MSRSTVGVPRRTFVAALGGMAAAAVTSAFGRPRPAPSQPSAPSPYDELVLADKPALYYQHLDDSGRWFEVVRGNHGTFPAGHGHARLPDGERAPLFDGHRQHALMPPIIEAGPSSSPKQWTVECWVRFDATRFPRPQENQYVQWMGVGDTSGYDKGNREWLARVYNASDGKEDRSQWVSGYASSWHGQGLACGQAYTEGWKAGTWHHYVFVVDRENRRVGLWWDGRQARGWVSMEPYGTELDHRGAPLRVGTRDHKSYLLGAVGKVATYTHQLSPERIAAHHARLATSPQ